MDLYDLEPGDRVRLTDGSVAEVVSETEDGRAILVRYVESEERSRLGTERLCSEDEIEERVNIY
jgi:bifunctional DNA-binding transcriptional regulator/antitoxin component of YhaV-PrlF toxin-antitoxin module